MRKAGLFSAAVTAFVVDSYKQLQPDNTQRVVAAALHALVVAANSSTTSSISASSAGASAEPSSLLRWINGLWFTSLFFSFAAALLCIMVKQWLDEYSARTRASSRNARHWARRHAFYRRGLDEWNIPAIISLLPLLLHVALFLFLAGAGVLLWTLDELIAAWLTGLTGILLVFYAVCTVLPFWISDCPFASPLVNQIRKAGALLFVIILQLLSACFRWPQYAVTAWRRADEARHTLYDGIGRFSVATYRGACRLPHTLYHLIHRSTLVVHSLLRRMSTASDDEAACGANAGDPELQPVTRFLTYEQLEKLERQGLAPNSVSQQLLATLQNIVARLDAAARLSIRIKSQSHFDRLMIPAGEELRDTLDSIALKWLILSVSDSDANAVGLQALGAVHPESSLAARLRTPDIIEVAVRENAITGTVAGTSSATEIVRVLRCLLCMRTGDPGFRFGLQFPASEMAPMKDTDFPDAALLWAAYNVFGYLGRYPRTGVITSSSTSTAMLVIRSQWLLAEHLVYFLLCSRLEDLTAVEWERIFKMLRSGALAPCLSHEAGHCRSAVCLLRPLSQLVVQGRFRETQGDRAGAPARLITRVLSSVRGWDGLLLSHVPSFLQYMTTRQFLDQPYDDETLTNLRNFVTHASRWSFQNVSAARAAIHALPYLLHVLVSAEQRATFARMDDAVRLCNIMAYLVHDPAMSAHGVWRDVDLHPTVTTEIDDVPYVIRMPSISEHSVWDKGGLPPKDSSVMMGVHLVLLPTQPSQSVAWKLLCGMSDVVFEDGLRAQLRLATILAIALCSPVGRGTEEEVGAMIDTFLAEIPCIDLLRHVARSYRAREFQVLAQHCIKLRPQWWRVGMDTIHKEPDSEFKSFALSMEEKLRQCGPCAQCPGCDGRLSVCSLDPTA